ncbi:MAG TPA: glycoside hydrolase family 3 N-terminal domain-containing protein [Microbacterium sp.]|uniref:glycoside hydrolase family 3 N-terminal domain-containing protein n=1 Tax=Microbacterium sp. TaxID=51671 RepID=UPI002B49C3AA|nr:glycoside hydrolase family 3 N-terminal domain-containing protein [Microbacterium sp.]HKT55714.1 glycoside hydrolase family 3 N-terminal domain-containing protein [Microbacterium sp.]
MSVDIERLLGRMTWEQKLLQLQIVWRPDAAERDDLVRRGLGATFWPPSVGEANALQRIAVEQTAHGIPLLIGLDVVHGQFTIFPTPLAQAASFAPEVAGDDARVSAVEARGNGVNWTFSPMVDITRDPRWGRVVEGFGEDVHLASAFTAAKVAGYQGTQLSAPDSVAGCLKHFVAYGAAEAGRDYNTTDVSDRRLRETYLETFRVGVEHGAAAVMASFNALNGHPMHANRALLTGVLKQEWGFDGVVVGDADGVAQLVDHGIAADERAAIALALEAGVDLVMGGTLLVDADGTALLGPADVSPDRIDDAVRRVLRLKERLGLFENPFSDAAAAGRTAEHRMIARRAAERCTVLLTNKGALPLPATGRILLAGPYARSLDHLGAWVQRFAIAPGESLADALAQELPRVDWDVADGEDFFHLADADLADIQGRAASADLVVLALGEPSRLSGEAASRADITLPDAQRRLIHALADAGVRIVVVLATGRPLVVEDWVDRVDALLCSWHLGTEAPAAIAATLSGRVNPGGRVPMTFPRAVGQVPIHYDHERTGRPPRTGGGLLRGVDAVASDAAELAGPNNTDDHYTSKFLDLPLGPRFDFGHGLTYTTFGLDHLTVSAGSVDPERLDDGVDVQVTVRNTGRRDGDDVLMLFVTDEVASVTQPVRRLRGFRRVHVPAGESVTVAFPLTVDDLGFWADGGTRLVEPGDFTLTVGDGMSSLTARLRAEASR